jgi:hypothetical protein
VEASAVPDSCVPKAEICNDGIDNDCNGFTDCADPACMTQGYACVPEWPSGWMPVALYDQKTPGGPTPTIPSCAAGDPNYGDLQAVGNYNPVPTAATCTCGTCGSPDLSGVSCSNPTVGTGSSAGPGATGKPGSIGTTCTTFTPFQSGGINGVCLVSGSNATGGGTCSAPSKIPNIPAWDATSGWEGAGRVCGPTNPPSLLKGAAAGCSNAGDYCLLAPKNGLVCIFEAGESSCPSSFAPLYSGQHNYSGSGMDTRTCSGTCGCTANNSNVTCSASVQVFGSSMGDSNCSGSSVTVTTAAPCYTAGSNPPLNWGGGTLDQLSGVATLTPSGGSCTASGSYALTGSIIPSGAQTTVCCVP